jgi:hypothetical protein
MGLWWTSSPTIPAPPEALSHDYDPGPPILPPVYRLRYRTRQITFAEPGWTNARFHSPEEREHWMLIWVLDFEIELLD